MTLQQREFLCAEACRQAMRDWRAGKIGGRELVWRTWQAQQRYGVGEVFGDDARRTGSIGDAACAEVDTLGGAQLAQEALCR